MHMVLCVDAFLTVSHYTMILPLDVPAEVECYHSLFPLEPESSPTPDKVGSYTQCINGIRLLLLTNR